MVIGDWRLETEDWRIGEFALSLSKGWGMKNRFFLRRWLVQSIGFLFGLTVVNGLSWNGFEGKGYNFLVLQNL